MNLNKKNLKKEEATIKEVYFENFEVELRNISALIEKYSYIALDTEFPGFVFSGQGLTQKEIYYDAIRSNVDKLKLIQVGLTLCDKDGEYPKETSTWQFNFNFDLNKDLYSIESIDLLSKSGINFDKLYSKGMQMERFAECLTSSGLILNEDITWISFHGAYDFAYLLKILTNLPLPDNENGFLDQIQTFFPNYFDVRYLVKKDNFRGSLTKLAQGLDINRIGSQHQAGSDSVVTSEIFFRLKKISDFDEIFYKGKNVLYGLGYGADEHEAVNFNQNYYANSSINNNSFNSNSNLYKGIMNQNPSSLETPNMFLNNINPQFYGNINPMVNRTTSSSYNNYNYAYNGYMGNLQGYNVNDLKFSK